MITVAEKAEELVNKSPYLREALTDRLINLSALARKLQPQIQAELQKEVTESAIFAALQRMQSSFKPYYAVNPAQYLDNLSLKSGLIEITVKNSPTLSQQLSVVAEESDKSFTNLFVATRGQSETTIITSNGLKAVLDQAFKQEEITSTIPGLTGISMQRTHDQVETTGVLQYPLRILAWEGISVIEIVTTLNEMMILVQDGDVDRAFVAIRKGLESVSGAN